jgi:hypothetical protein
MSLNVTFDGFAYLDDGTISNSNVQYQAYFCHVNGGSSPSTWNDVRTVENTGYWNVNLGDGDWLGQDGGVASGDVVVIVFWRGGTRLGTDCSVLAEWGATEIILDGSSTYTRPTQVRENILPNLIWSFPANGVAGTLYSSSHNSNDLHTWDWMGTTMEHMYEYNDSEPIFSIDYVRFTSYYWDDGNQDINLPLVAGGSHSWSLAGDYEVKIVIEDHCGGTVTGTQNIRIKYPPPVPDLICNEAAGNTVDDPDTVVSFNYNGTNPYSRIYNIDWSIEDDTYTTTSGLAVDTIYHTNGTGTSWYGHAASPGAFTDPGTHNIAIIVYWNDGFDNQTVLWNEDVIQGYFAGPSVDFTQDPDPVPVGSGVEFTNTTVDSENRVGTAGAGERYDWTWDDDGTVDTAADVAYSYMYSNTPTTDNVDIELCAYWNDGWDDHVACVEKDLAIETTVFVSKIDCYYELTVYGTSDDGTVSSYSWDIERSTTSGISGPWEIVWSSPNNIDQKEKTICFNEANYFRVTGYVYGTGATTSDSAIIEVDVVCPGEECALIIWNGTGIFDSGGDWNHTGHGTEAAYAKYEGSNGLDATGFTNNKKIYFQDTNENNVDDYDLLSMYINLKQYPANGNFYAYFEDGTQVNLRNYLETQNLNTWQRILVPLEDFGLSAPINLKRLTIESDATMGFYLDNVEFVIGATIRQVVAIERPDMTAQDTGSPSMTAENLDLRPKFAPPQNIS